MRGTFCIYAVWGCPHWAQRLAAIGISLKHSVHFLVVGSAGFSRLRIRSTSLFIGKTTRKYTAAARRRKEITALIKSPMRNLLPLIVKTMPEKSGVLNNAA